jgi:hypothetical protein
METVILVAIFDILLLSLAFTSKNFLYSKCQNLNGVMLSMHLIAIKKIIKYLDILDYKLGTGHLCNNNYYYFL